MCLLQSLWRFCTGDGKNGNSQIFLECIERLPGINCTAHCTLFLFHQFSLFFFSPFSYSHFPPKLSHTFPPHSITLSSWHWQNPNEFQPKQWWFHIDVTWPKRTSPERPRPPSPSNPGVQKKKNFFSFAKVLANFSSSLFMCFHLWMKASKEESISPACLPLLPGLVGEIHWICSLETMLDATEGEKNSWTSF